mgnify:CR=1 FL=1
MNQYHGIETLQTEEDIVLLKKYASQISPLTCYLELGVAQGGSAQVAVESVRQMVPVFGVDSVATTYAHPRFWFIQAKAEDVVGEFIYPIGLLFMDHDHNKISQDFLQWQEKVVPQGVVIFHDGDCQETALGTPEGWEVVRHADETPNSSMYIIRKCPK